MMNLRAPSQNEGQGVVKLVLHVAAIYNPKKMGLHKGIAIDS